MPKTVIEVPESGMRERHDIKVRQAEERINDYVESFEKKRGNRPEPSGKFPSRQIGEPVLRYLTYLQDVHVANNDLISEVINFQSDKLALVDLETIDRKLKSQSTSLKNAREDMELAIKEVKVISQKAIALATEAKELLADANARLDEIDETMDDYFE